MKKGSFIISLDFELFWGVRDKRTIDNYGTNIEGAISVMPRMLDLFEFFNVGATFATVGLMFGDNKNDLLDMVPIIKPKYLDENLSPYNYFSQVSNKDSVNKYHFAKGIIANILLNTRNEIATHTFSHYYCLEPGQNVNEFEADIIAAKKVAKKEKVDVKSIVFPRNQYNPEYIDVCNKHGITSFRGNEKSWFYSASKGQDETVFKRAFRLFDTYINISGHNTYSYEEIKSDFPYNMPSSRFLRPFSPKLKVLEKFRLNRIKRSMTYAAKKGEVFHLWWHPHNFGTNQGENINILEQILAHYLILNKKYGFENNTMNSLSLKLKNEEK